MFPLQICKKYNEKVGFKRSQRTAGGFAVKPVQPDKHPFEADPCGNDFAHVLMIFWPCGNGNYRKRLNLVE